MKKPFISADEAAEGTSIEQTSLLSISPSIYLKCKLSLKVYDFSISPLNTLLGEEKGHVQTMRLSEFQRSPIVQRNMATNWLNPASSCVTGYIQGGHSYHPRADKITSSIYSQLTWLGISVGILYTIYMQDS